MRFLHAGTGAQLPVKAHRHRPAPARPWGPIALLLGLAACRPAAGTLEFEGYSMGTTWSARVVTADAQQAESLQLSIQRELDRVERALSTWRAGSDLSRLSRAGPGERVPAAQATLEVLALADRVVEVTGGAFDPTIGPLVSAWGFGAGGEAAGPTEPPDEALLAAARERVDWSAIEWGDGWILRRRADVELDASAIAKGYGVDQAARTLEQAGYEAFLIEVGGELVARGSPPDAATWRVGVVDPAQAVAATPDDRSRDGLLDATRAFAAATLALTDCAVATSGDYRQGYGVSEGRVSHVIDPRTGRPAGHYLASVTVIAPSCALADALATGVMVLGPDAGHACLESLDGVEGMLIERGPDGVGLRPPRMTSGMQRYLHGGARVP